METSFGDKLLKIRKKKNISQEQLAQKIGVTRQTVSNWELNITLPNIDDLKKISKALDISYDKLLNTTPKIDEQKNEKIKTSKLFIIVLRVMGIIFIINIVILGIVLIISKLHYNKVNVVGSYSLECNYNESSYRYNIEYNKKNKIVNTTIEGNIDENEQKIQWIKDLDKFIFSKEITNPSELKKYIYNEYEENNGHCK